MQFNLLVITAAFTTSVLTNPISLTPAHSLLAARDEYTGVKCGSPCSTCNLGQTTYVDLQILIDSIEPDRQYCLKSDGSRQNYAAGNWALVKGCGPNNAAIWMQSYIHGTWCLLGADIRLAAYTVGLVCKSTDKNPKIWGIVQISEQERWIQVGHSNGCAEGNAVAP